MADHQKYRITEKLDAGGMAEVFRGVAESGVGGIRKAVAIKRILPNLTKNKKFISMFLDEARVSMHLQHANIVGVFDIGIADTAYFIVMEYVEGANLKTLIESLRRQGKRMPVAHVLYIAMEICKGLAYAHDVNDPETGDHLGIVHRDISPPNILISKRGEVKLVDFGLAKATSQLETTDPGVVKGKFSYLSPEAASGKEVDKRADIFSVGIMMYELLTGKRLFYGETDYQTVELVRQARVPAIGTQNPDVKPELEEVIRKALAPQLEARYQTAGDFQDAIAGFLFSQRMKVTSRDIEQLVNACLQEKSRALPKAPKKADNVIDGLINDEIVKFTSIEDISGLIGGQTSPTDSGGAPLDPGQFLDPRNFEDSADPPTGPRQQRVTEGGGIEYMLEGTNPNLRAQQQKDDSGSTRAGGYGSGVEVAYARETEDPRPKIKKKKTSGDSSGVIKVVAVLLLCVGVIAATAWFVLFKK